MDGTVERDPMHAANCRRLILVVPEVRQYPLHLTLDERRLRMLAEWELAEAAKEARKSGLETR